MKVSDFENIISIPSSIYKNSDFECDDEGITHLNVYSKSQYPLGQFLSNFAHTPIEYQGIEFASVEAIWYWKLTGDMSICPLTGAQAKKKGKSLTKINDSLSELELCEINWIKINQYPLVKKHFLDTNLPLAHYYMMYGKKIDADSTFWTAKLWEKIRIYMKENI